MRQLNTIQNFIFIAGALLMVVGTGCVVFGVLPKVFSIVFAVGTFSFSIMQMCQTYSGPSLTIRRLRSLMTIGDIVLMLSGLLMIETVYHVIFPYVATTIDGYNAYVRYVYNNWVVLLLIGAVFELYTTHRISHELNKEENKDAIL